MGQHKRKKKGAGKKKRRGTTNGGGNQGAETAADPQLTQQPGGEADEPREIESENPSQREEQQQLQPQETENDYAKSHAGDNEVAASAAEDAHSIDAEEEEGDREDGGPAVSRSPRVAQGNDEEEEDLSLGNESENENEHAGDVIGKRLVCDRLGDLNMRIQFLQLHIGENTLFEGSFVHDEKDGNILASGTRADLLILGFEVENLEGGVGLSARAVVQPEGNVEVGEGGRERERHDVPQVVLLDFHQLFPPGYCESEHGTLHEASSTVATRTETSRPFQNRPSLGEVLAMSFDAGRGEGEGEEEANLERQAVKMLERQLRLMRDDDDDDDGADGGSAAFEEESEEESSMYSSDDSERVRRSVSSASSSSPSTAGERRRRRRSRK